MAWQRTRITIPKGLTPKEREALADEVIEFIQERSEGGVGIRKQGKGFANKPFPNYEEKYAKRKGVSVSDVDLTLSGEMLGSIELISHKNGQLLIGFDKGDKKLNGKAEGNITGIYGKSKKKKPRNFLGITRRDLLQLLPERITNG